MALLLSEADVRSILTMPMALEAVEEIFRRLANNHAILHSRRRLDLPDKGLLHYMAAADVVGGYSGLKIYTSVRGALRFMVPLYRSATGELAAIIEADYLGQVRTGAASGVATKFMAREDARIAGIIGTGLQARTQLEAIAAVRSLELIRAYGRKPERRAAFAKEMSERLKLRVEASESAELAVHEADVIVTATHSSKPVLEGSWVPQGAHINAIGANFAQKRELDEDAVRRCGIIVVDSREQSLMEAGDLIQVLGEDPKRWSSVRELSDIVSGRLAGRTHTHQVTLFKSNGVAVEDIAVGALVFEYAQKRGIGRQVPLWEGGK
jgi:ornithine cyclodeaminase/alanine dehydrogenase-like protein (mu-crystallin family)